MNPTAKREDRGSADHAYLNLQRHEFVSYRLDNVLVQCVSHSEKLEESLWLVEAVQNSKTFDLREKGET